MVNNPTFSLYVDPFFQWTVAITYVRTYIRMHGIITTWLLREEHVY